jgi:AcrR family transcriptional regulator
MSKKSFNTKGINYPKTRLGMAKMNKLAEAAEALFSEVGFYNTSIVDICKRADTAVGTFYIYFETKADVYRYLLKKHNDDILANMSEAISAHADKAKRGRESIRSFIKYMREHPNAYTVILGSLSVDRSMFFCCISAFAEALEGEFVGEGGDSSALAYSLIGISGMLGLKAISEEMTDEDIDKMISGLSLTSLV